MIGLGVDVVDLDRFARVLDRHVRFVDRVFTPSERRYCEQVRSPTKRVERYAARFAAKEAFMKALGVGFGAFAFHDVEVRRDEESGRPALSLSGKAAAAATEHGAVAWHLTMSHSDAVAVAVVALE